MMSIVCSSRDEQERPQGLGFCGVGVGSLLMFPIWSHLCSVYTVDAADRFVPTSNLGG